MDSMGGAALSGWNSNHHVMLLRYEKLNPYPITICMYVHETMKVNAVGAAYYYTASDSLAGRIQYFIVCHWYLFQGAAGWVRPHASAGPCWVDLYSRDSSSAEQYLWLRGIHVLLQQMHCAGFPAIPRLHDIFPPIHAQGNSQQKDGSAKTAKRTNAEI